MHKYYEFQYNSLCIFLDNKYIYKEMGNDYTLTIDKLMVFVPERFLADEKYRKGHLSIIAPAPGTRILGMHTPQMKSVAKDLVKNGDWRRQVEIWQRHRPLTGPDGLTHEERMIWGLVIDYAKVPLSERLQMLEKFIPAIDNWAICDNFCCNAKWVDREDQERIWAYLVGLMDAREEFRARVGLVLALAHYLDPAHLVRTLDTLCRRGYGDEDPYYIRMAAAWLLAEALCKQYESALPYVERPALSRWIHNKAIQKARESYRITPEQKAYLNTLKY